MKLKIRYSSKERVSRGPNAYSHVIKEGDLVATHIIRTPCGYYGAARNRFYYSGIFIAPDDAEFVDNGTIRTNINRKLNRKFNPKKLNFDGWTCILPIDGVSND
jgi:hypothetical protein